MPNELTINLKNIYDIQEDDSDPVYAIRIGPWRCKVEEASKVYYVAVPPATKKTFPPHCGLMVENTFYIKRPGSITKEYKYLLGHAFLDSTDKNSTEFVLYFCSERPKVFQKLRGVHRNYEGATAQCSPGIACFTSCSDIVGHVRTELAKPFDPKWKERLTEGWWACYQLCPVHRPNISCVMQGRSSWGHEGSIYQPRAQRPGHSIP